MKLPTISTPTYKTTLYSIKEPVTYRPFLVGEQKVLMMAAESSDSDEILRVLKRCVSSCTNGKVDVETLPLFDLLLLFVRIRSKAVGEVLEKIYICQHTDEEGTKCAKEIPFSIDLDTVELHMDEQHTNVINLTDQVGVKMRYPSVSQLKDIADINTTVGQLDMVVQSIESIFSDDEIIDVEQVSKQELDDWIGMLNAEQLKKIIEFFATQPKLHHETVVKCPECSTESKIVLQGIEDFF